jgi:type IV pilus assembly protein PilM
LTSVAPNLESKLYQLGPMRRLDRWLNAMPHPPLVVEISPNHVAAARWGKTRGTLEANALEPVPFGAIVPSPVEVNVAQPDAVRGALRRALARIPGHTPDLALLIPDPVVRVFILSFETFPRRADEALPLLRWRLKKSVPFDVDETVVSWMRQLGREGNLEIVAAVARQSIVREYEDLISSLNFEPAVVLGSTLATLPLLEERGATLLVRMSGRTLTTVIVQGANLAVYRSGEMPSDAAAVEPQLILDEIFPAIAYYQDTWDAMVDRARLSGFGSREELFRQALADELKVSVGPLSASDQALWLSSSARDLMSQDLDSVVGWMMNGGS